MATADQIRITRTLIPDTEAIFGAASNETLFSDSEIADFVTAGRDSYLRGAALACLAIGTSEAMISKVIKTQDLSTNGAQVADSMTKKAELLFKRAAVEDELDNGFYSNIVDFHPGVYNPELTEWELS